MKRFAAASSVRRTHPLRKKQANREFFFSTLPEGRLVHEKRQRITGVIPAVFYTVKQYSSSRQLARCHGRDRCGWRRVVQIVAIFDRISFVLTALLDGVCLGFTDLFDGVRAMFTG